MNIMGAKKRAARRIIKKRSGKEATNPPQKRSSLLYSDRLYLAFMNIAIALLILILIFSVYLLTGFCTAGKDACLSAMFNGGNGQLMVSEEELAKCLTNKGIVMYGAYWCGSCKNQRRLFGDAFQYVAYVECAENTELCRERGITGYPTWVINDKLYPGEMSFQMLSGLSGCDYP